MEVDLQLVEQQTGQRAQTQAEYDLHQRLQKDADGSMRPCSSAFAMPKEAEKSTRPTASSMATTISSRRVRGPLALYCLTTIRVAAGAVAEAMEPV